MPVTIKISLCEHLWINYSWILLKCVIFVEGGTGFHNNGITVNPQDLAPTHAGSVFGLMNTVGSVPGKIFIIFI